MHLLKSYPVGIRNLWAQMASKMLQCGPRGSSSELQCSWSPLADARGGPPSQLLACRALHGHRRPKTKEVHCWPVVHPAVSERAVKGIRLTLSSHCPFLSPSPKPAVTTTMRAMPQSMEGCLKNWLWPQRKASVGIARLAAPCPVMRRRAPTPWPPPRREPCHNAWRAA